MLNLQFNLLINGAFGPLKPLIMDRITIMWIVYGVALLIMVYVIVATSADNRRARKKLEELKRQNRIITKKYR